MKRVVLAVLLIVCMGVLAGCNTFGGMGKDIKSGGDAIEKASGTKQ